jgi:hypothetical protein
MRLVAENLNLSLWDNVEKYGGAREAADNMAHAFTHPRARAHTHTNMKYLMFFPRLSWFRESSSLLRYTYVACLIIFCSRFISVDKVLKSQNLSCVWALLRYVFILFKAENESSTEFTLQGIVSIKFADYHTSLKLEEIPFSLKNLTSS